MAALVLIVKGGCVVKRSTIAAIGAGGFSGYVGMRAYQRGADGR